MQQAFEDYKTLKNKEKGEAHKNEHEWNKVMHSKHNNMSEGAQNATSIHKIRTNREGSASNSKGHHTPGHQVHKGPKKK